MNATYYFLFPIAVLLLVLVVYKMYIVSKQIDNLILTIEADEEANLLLERITNVDLTGAE